MRLKNLFLVLVAVVGFVACGQITKETVSPVPSERITPSGKTVAIMPFADYTPDSSPEFYWRRNVLVMESLEDELSRYGLVTAPEEDVVRYLMDEHIIEPPEVFFTDIPYNNYMRSEISSGVWSDEMMRELQYAITRNESIEKDRRRQEVGQTSQGGSPLHISLTSSEVAKIGDHFGVDYIVRGRLIEFQRGVAKDDFNPFHIGMLPFVFNTSQRMFFGLAKSDNYELMDKMALGGIVGTAVGHANKNFPFDEDKDTETSGHPLFGPTVTDITDYHALNTALWGLAGTGLAYLSHNGGNVPRAVVQIRIMVQDARTGRLLWSNRSEVEVIPESIYAEQEYRKLVAKAIRRATSSLVHSFVATVEGGLLNEPVPAAQTASPADQS
jgi:TolB-like protein